MYAGIVGDESFQRTLKSQWFGPDYFSDQNKVHIPHWTDLQCYFL